MTTGEVVEPPADPKTLPSPRRELPQRAEAVADGDGQAGDRFRGLHGDIRRKGFDQDQVHPIAHDLAVAWFGVESLTDLDGRMLHDFRKRLAGMDQAAVLEAWEATLKVRYAPTNEAAVPVPETVDAEFRPTDQEAIGLEAKDIIEAAQTEDAWASLAAWAGSDEQLWSLLAERAPSLGQLELLRWQAKRAGMLTPAVERAAGGTARDLKRKLDALGS